MFYGGGYREPAHKFAAAFPGFVALVRDKFRVDELYGFLIIRPLQGAVPGAVPGRRPHPHRPGAGARRRPWWSTSPGASPRTFQVGDVQRYLAVFAVGVLALFYLATTPAAPSALAVTVDGTTVDVDASKGAPAGRALLLRVRLRRRRPRPTGQGRAARRARFSYEGTRQLHHPGDHPRSALGLRNHRHPASEHQVDGHPGLDDAAAAPGGHRW